MNEQDKNRLTKRAERVGIKVTIEDVGIWFSSPGMSIRGIYSYSAANAFLYGVEIGLRLQD